MQGLPTPPASQTPGQDYPIAPMNEVSRRPQSLDHILGSCSSSNEAQACNVASLCEARI